MFPILIFAVSMLFSTLSNGYAATYYVATTGKDGNSCDQAQSVSTPKRTINNGLACLASGDTLIIKGGSYNEYICPACGLAQIASGKSWDKATTIKGAQGETVILNPTSGLSGSTISMDTGAYISFEKLILDGNNYQVPYSAINANTPRVRYKDIEMRFFRWTPVGVGADYNEFININIHDVAIEPTASGDSHGFYISGNYGLYENNILDLAKSYSQGSFCYHVYTSNYSRKVGNVFRGNSVRNCMVGIGLYATNGTIIENNIFYNGRDTGISLGFGAATTTIRNNTLYGHVGNGIQLVDNVGATQIQNNLIYGSQGHGIYIESGSAVSISNNLSSNNAGGNFQDQTGRVVQSNNLFGNSYNPKFANSAIQDFHLLAGSAAIDAGLTIGALTIDKEGTKRPQGSKYDIGAYEYRTSTLSPPANFQLIDMSK